ncbi:uncharacterized protein BDCG_00435 [Blastomyces dermatitidis ER-3]|uniref:Integral membrane protein n=1 Tax=Ajellomyces dermatitidis (strain ER-3 / ATCC MYA-2586) TaxID=559297 RepID=A0ABP2EPF7_AJEDR|nr:uncharacterized protein BDCG_00435 [Blastomyces dermatitidis ER-3]EEQ83630.2 hypothetical protein BDCG_00435 [Blastomyces dermatitidis ER-3]
MFPLTVLCLVLLVGNLSGGPSTSTAAAAVITTTSESPLLAAESILDSTMMCPLVFSAVLFVALALLSFIPVCVSVHKMLSTGKGPITVAKVIRIVFASLVGKHMVTAWSSLHTTLSRIYSQDGALGAARFAVDRAVSAFRQTWAYRLYRWISPSGQVISFRTLFPPFMLYCGYIKFGAPACAYLSGLLAGIANDSELRISSCDYVITGIYAPVEKHRWHDDRLQNLYCSGALSGFVTRTEWKEWIEQKLYSLEMFHLALFVSLVALAFLPTFILYTVISLKDFDYVIVRKADLAAMKVAENPTPKKAGRASGVIPARNGTIGNRTSASQRTLMIDQLKSRIRELEVCNLDSTSMIRALEGKSWNKDRVLARLMKDRADLQLENSRERSRREYLTEKLAKSIKQQDTLNLTSSLKLAREQLGQEQMKVKIAEDMYSALRTLAGNINLEPSLHKYIHDFDKIAEKCNVDNLSSSARKARLEVMQQTLKNKLPYLLREATIKAYAVRNTRCDEQIAAIKKNGRPQERSRECAPPYQFTRNRTSPAYMHCDPNDNLATNTELDAVRQQLATVVADLEAQRVETAAMIGLLEGERSAHALSVASLNETHNMVVTTHSSQTQELKVEIRAARRHGEEVRAGKEKEIADLRQELEAKNQEIITHTYEVQEKGRALLRMEGELHEARRSFGALHVAANAQTQTRVTGAELAQLQQQLASSATREEALSAELAHVHGLLRNMELENAQSLEQQRQAKDNLIAQYQTALFSKDFEYKQQIDQLQSAGRALDAECQKLRARVQGHQATSSVLADANAKVVECRAQINHLMQKLSQLTQAPTDDLTRQHIEKLRARVQVLEKGDRDNVTDKIRSTQRIKSLEEDLQKTRVALSNAKAEAASPRRALGPNPLRAKVDDLNKALEAKNAEISALQVQIETQRDKIKSTEDQLSYLVSLGWIPADSSKGLQETPILEAEDLIKSEVEATKRAGEPLYVPQKRQRTEEYESSAILPVPATWVQMTDA